MSVVLTFNVTEKEADRVYRAAKRERKSMGQFLRDRLVRNPKNPVPE